MSAWGKETKYGSNKVSYGGYSFASKLESAIHQILLLQEKAGEITGIQCQDSIYLTDARILYKPDFKCIDAKTGQEMWVEAKGFVTDVWAIKKRLWKFYGPGPLHVWGGTYQRPKFLELILPKGEQK